MAAEWLLLAVAAGTAVLGVIVRFTPHSALWLDEALTVNISRLPLPQLFTALRHDGSPPLYYLVLHFWMRAFGTSTGAVRVLPAVISAATLPVAWRLGRTIGGRNTAFAAVVLLATSPFAIRYGSENRMYSLVMFLSMLGGLALVRCLRTPTPRWLVVFGVSGGLLLLTHYWALYLVGAIGLLLFWGSVRGTNRTASRLTLAALASGSLLFLPWVPSFLFQTAHTGTPWAASPSPGMLIWALGEFSGWDAAFGSAHFGFQMAFVGVLLILVIVSTFAFGRRPAVLLGLRSQVPGERWAVPAAGVVFLTLLLALFGGVLAHAAFAYRYASVVLPPFIMVTALGVSALSVTYGRRLLMTALLIPAAILGLLTGANQSMSNRTQATVVAATIKAVARPGDVIAYCPDQLGPAVSRLLPSRFIQVTFPRFDSPQLINWVDYAKVNAAAPPPGLEARQLVNLAGPTHQVWLVWEPGYRTLGFDCMELKDTLAALRPNFTEPVTTDPAKYYEHESLERFAPA